MGIFGVVLGLIVLCVLVFLGAPTFICFLLSTSVVILSTGMPLVATINTVFMPGFASFITSTLLLFVFGAILAKLLEKAGALDSFSAAVFKVFGEKFALLAILAIAAVMTYGGIGFMVVMITVIPMSRPICIRAGINPTLGVLAMFAGCCTFALSTPGSAQIHNLFPMSYLNTTSTAALIPGIIAAVVECVLICISLQFFAKREKGRYTITPEELAEISDSGAELQGKKLPHWFLSVSPLIVVAILLNFVKLTGWVALCIAAIYAAVVMAPYLSDQIGIKGYQKHFMDSVNEGFRDGLALTGATCLSVGFGAVVSNCPAWPDIVEWITVVSGGNGLVGVSIMSSLSALFTGSASGALGIVTPIVADTYLGTGLNPEAIHRVMNIAVSTLDSTPWAGIFVALSYQYHFSIKKTYPYLFVTNVLAPAIGIVVCIITCSIFL
jgi:H+/gluconate symporter-like permease